MFNLWVAFHRLRNTAKLEIVSKYKNVHQLQFKNCFVTFYECRSKFAACPLVLRMASSHGAVKTRSEIERKHGKDCFQVKPFLKWLSSKSAATLLKMLNSSKCCKEDPSTILFNVLTTFFIFWLLVTTTMIGTILGKLFFISISDVSLHSQSCSMQTF